MELPKISIVIVNLNGKHHLVNCFTSIMKLNYPKDKIEVIVVDNGSTDGSVDLIRSKFSWIKLIKNIENEGFAKPSNDGARAASGEYVAFLNNDMMVHRDWLLELVNSIKNNDAACAGSVIMNWKGDMLDFAGGSVTFYGMGFQYDFHRPMSEVEHKLREDRPLFFACGGAMLINREIFLECRGFDQDYFAYFEDIDLGWRLNVLGYKVVLSVKSRVQHRHHSTGNTFSKVHMRVLYERNSLYTIYKNYGDELMQKTFLPTVLMNNAMIFNNSGIKKEDFDLRVSTDKLKLSWPAISNTAAAQMCALNDFITNLSSLNKKREYIQSHRKISDEEIIKFIDDPFACIGKEASEYNVLKYQFIKVFGIDKVFKKTVRHRVLLACNDKVGSKMAGPAIRYYEFAKALSKTCDVVLASCGACDIHCEEFEIIEYDYQNTAELDRQAIQADILIVQGFVLEYCKRFADISKTRYLIVDLYDPFVIENIEIFKKNPMSERTRDFQNSSKALLNQLKAGDFFLAANDKQKDYWLGMLSSINRVSPEMYDLSRDYSKLIDMVPFGISDDAPVHKRDALKGVWQGINKDDTVLIWGGGVWNWFDPLTLIKAIYEISKSRNNVKLFFLGVKHPNPDIPQMEMLSDAVELAKSLGIYDKYVFFNFGWVDYNDRQNYLLEADIGVSCHFNTLETRFSFRTRFLDYLWAGLPIICTKGDYFAETVEHEKLGLAVDYQNEKELAQAIVNLMDDKEYYARCRENIQRVALEYRWSVVTKPVIDYCSDPVFSKTRLSADEIDEVKDNKKGTISQRLTRIENSIKYEARTSENNRIVIGEIENWMELMNNRFIRIKNLLNPLRKLRRLFRRH